VAKGEALSKSEKSSKKKRALFGGGVVAAALATVAGLIFRSRKNS
jgi:hypothetical protein